jgi:hypothetical protein
LCETNLSSSLTEANGLRNTIIAQCSLPALSFAIVSLLISAVRVKYACLFSYLDAFNTWQLIFLAFLVPEYILRTSF